RRGDRAERASTALAERPFESRLPAQRLVAEAARRAELGERADAAPRHTAEADRRAEIEERLRARGVERLAGALLHATHVGVERQDVAAEGEVADRRRGVRADARELGQVVGPSVLRDCARGPV